MFLRFQSVSISAIHFFETLVSDMIYSRVSSATTNTTHRAHVYISRFRTKHFTRKSPTMKQVEEKIKTADSNVSFETCCNILSCHSRKLFTVLWRFDKYTSSLYVRRRSCLESTSHRVHGRPAGSIPCFIQSVAGENRKLTSRRWVPCASLECGAHRAVCPADIPLPHRLHERETGGRLANDVGRRRATHVELGYLLEHT